MVDIHPDSRRREPGHERGKGERMEAGNELRVDGATQKVICSMLERTGGIVRSRFGGEEPAKDRERERERKR